MNVLHRGWRYGIALVAIWLFLAQSIAGAFAIGEASGVRLDAFGNPLCIAGSEQSAPAGDHHDKQPSCCTISCAASLGSMAPHPDERWQPARFAKTIDIKPPRVPWLRAALSDHNPGIPRAPPLQR